MRGSGQARLDLPFTIHRSLITSYHLPITNYQHRVSYDSVIPSNITVFNSLLLAEEM